MKKADSVDEALAYFNITSDRKKVTLAEAEKVFNHMHSSYSTEDQGDVKASLAHFNVLKDYIQSRNIANLVKKFRSTYQHEIIYNRIDPAFVQTFGALDSTATAERLMDKKFAYYFLNNLQRCGYDQCVQYGVSHRENTEPAMPDGNSRMAAVLLYSNDNTLPPLLIELGNKLGAMQVGETTVSAREGASQKANVSVFKVISDPNEQQIHFTGSHVTGVVPANIKDKTHNVTDEFVTQVKECVREALNSAIHKMPREMKKIAEARAKTVESNSNKNGYYVAYDDRTEENKSPPAAVRSWKREQSPTPPAERQHDERGSKMPRK